MNGSVYARFIMHKLVYFEVIPLLLFIFFIWPECIYQALTVLYRVQVHKVTQLITLWVYSNLYTIFVLIMLIHIIICKKETNTCCCSRQKTDPNQICKSQPKVLKINCHDYSVHCALKGNKKSLNITLETKKSNTLYIYTHTHIHTVQKQRDLFYLPSLK